MKPVSINDYYSTAYVERVKNQQIYTHSIMSSIFTSLLSVARNLLFANSGQIKNLNINTGLSTIPLFLRSEKSYNKQIPYTYKKIQEFQYPITHYLLTNLTRFNLMNSRNPSTQNK